jgi:hypothetical protein
LRFRVPSIISGLVDLSEEEGGGGRVFAVMHRLQHE